MNWFSDSLTRLATDELGNPTVITVSRSLPEGGTYNEHGEWVPAARETLAVHASVQHISGEDVQLFPEGLRETQTIKIYSAEQLNGMDDIGQNAADIVQFNGRDYMVFTVKSYPSYSLFVSIARRLPKVEA